MGQWEEKKGGRGSLPSAPTAFGVFRFPLCVGSTPATPPPVKGRDRGQGTREMGKRLYDIHQTKPVCVVARSSPDDLIGGPHLRNRFA